MRRTCHGKLDWVDIKWKGGVLNHPIQQDGSSCGVIVVMIARAVMNAFPVDPIIRFGTSKKEMALARKTVALQSVKASVFNVENNCVICSMSKPAGSGPPIANWIQCDACERWFHEQCLGMDTKDFEKAEQESWNCNLCP